MVVIDEAHNFISGIVNKYNRKFYIYEIISFTYECRRLSGCIITGTPIINYPNEVGVMMNILRGYIKTLESKTNVLTNDKIDNKFFKIIQTFSIC